MLTLLPAATVDAIDLDTDSAAATATAAFPPPCLVRNGVVLLIQMNQARANRFQPTDCGRQFT